MARKISVYENEIGRNQSKQDGLIVLIWFDIVGWLLNFRPTMHIKMK